MGAGERIEGADLHPAGEELAAGPPREAADVGAAEGHAGERQVEQHREALPQLLPAAGVVSGPHRGVVSDSREPRAGQHEGPAPVGVLEERAGGPALLVAVEVAHVLVGDALLGARRVGLDDVREVLPAQRQDGAAQPQVASPARGLVHVVPDAGDAGLEQRAVLLAPPGAHLLAVEVRKRRVSGPDPEGEGRAVLAAAEDVPLEAVAVDGIVGIHLHPGVHDGDDAEAVVRQLAQQPAGVAEAARMPAEAAVAAHVADVEVEDVGGDAPLAQPARHPAQLPCAPVRPAGLVVSQRPQGRQRRPADPGRVARQDLGGGGAGEDADVEPARQGLEAHALGVAGRHVEP